MTNYLSTADAAKYTGLSVSTLERLRISGGGPGYIRPTHRRVLYAICDLDTWLQSRKHKSTSEYTNAPQPV
jgi:hypothetical protein